MSRHHIAGLLGAVALLAGCGAGGDFELPVETGGGSGGGGAAAVTSCEQLFAQRVQPRLDYCRSCHVPGGVGDVEDGRLFMLADDPSTDAAKLRAAWEALGGAAVNPSRILTMSSGTDARSHTGGAPWPVGSEAYDDMKAMLDGYSNPSACQRPAS